MTRVLALLVLLLASPAWAQYTTPLVTAAAKGVADNQTATTAAIDTTGAGIIVVVFGHYSALDGAAAVTDNKGNTWTNCGTAVNANSLRVRICYLRGGTVGTGHTFTLTSVVAILPGLAVAAWADASVASPLDQQSAGGSGTGSTSFSAGSLTPSENCELVVFGSSWLNNNGATVSVDGGFSIAAQIDRGGNGAGVALAYLVQTTAAAANPTATPDMGGDTFSAVSASFKAASTSCGGAAADPLKGQLGRQGAGR